MDNFDKWFGGAFIVMVLVWAAGVSFTVWVVIQLLHLLAKAVN